MATVKTKKRMMYAVFVIIFISGGVEYAVILPTLWLYLHTSYDSPEYMLGLVLSAYSVAAFFSSPLFGRLSDRIRCTKQIFLVCSTFELVGSFLYFVGISQWLCVGSRFISGFGAASEAIALAEVSRYTTEKERTGIISNLVASRQIALLIGPGLNVFLREANFTIGIFEVNKFSSPGAFMVIMWFLLLLIILTLYTEPKHIYAEIEIENRRDRVQEINVPSPNNEPNTETSQRHEERGAIDHTVYSTDNVSVASTSSFQTKHLLLSCEREDFVYPPLSHDTVSQGHQEPTPRESPFLSDTSDSEASSHFHDTRPPTLSSEDSADTITNENQEVVPGTPKFELSCSMDLLISAERIINSSHWVKRPLCESEHWKKDELYFNEDHFGLSADSTDANERSPLMGRHSVLRSSNSRFMKSQGYNEPYIERSLSALLDDPIAREGKMGFFCNEYIRDEIIAIVCLLFCAMFSQVCVETMVLPLTLKYLNFDELENSLLYCACGVEIIIVFLIMSRLSRCLSDRVMMMFGAIMILASNIWLLWYLPRAPPRTYTFLENAYRCPIFIAFELYNLIQNLPYFTIAVFLDILSLPFLLVCSTSLYSKLTRKETAGLSQGLRRGVVGLGTIIAPLWGSSAVNQPYVLLGVLVALQALSLVLCVLSFKRLVPTAASSVSVVSPSTSRTRSPAHSSSFRNYSSNSNNANIQVPNSRSAHSTPYGSIQRSLAGSSYHSVNSLAEDRALLRA